MKSNDSEYRIIKGIFLRIFRLLKKRRAVAAAAAFLIIFTMLFGTGVLSFGYDAFVGAEFIGVVPGRAETEAKISVTNALLDKPIAEELRLYPKIVLSGNFTPDGEVEDNIRLVSGQMHRGTGFVLDGETLFALGSSDEMRRLIDEYTAPYKTPNTTAAALEGNIVYESGVYPDSLFVTYNKAFSLLNENGFNVLTGETVTEIEVIERPVRQIEDAALYIGDVEVADEGADGEKEITKTVMKRNGKIVSEESVSETLIAQPVARIEEVGTLVMSGTGSGIFSRPVSGSITSGFGERWGRVHKGTDFAGSIGDNVKAADSGTVEFAGAADGFGNLIIIDHKNGFETYYAHLNAIYVSAGEKIKSGQVIGTIGTTGNSTGPHLHFEIRENKEAKNPMDFLG